MVHLKGETSNQIFSQLVQWEQQLSVIEGIYSLLSGAP